MAISLLSIARTQRASRPPLVVIHGPHGVGKTTLGASAYNPIFLPFEDGLQGLEVDAFPLLKSWEFGREALFSLLTEQHSFGCAVIDSIDWLEPLIWAHTAAMLGKPSIEAIPYGKGYTEAATFWREFLGLCTALRDQRGMAVILIAHSEIKRFDAPDVDGYDHYQIKLHKMASALVQEWADIIGFANFETKIKKTDAGFGNEKNRGVTTGRRLLHVSPNPAYVAKNRFGMPDKIELSWNALVAAIQGHSQPNPQSDPQE